MSARAAVGGARSSKMGFFCAAEGKVKDLEEGMQCSPYGSISHLTRRRVASPLHHFPP